MIGKVKKAKLYIFVGRLAKPHTVELGTSRLKGDGTNGNPLTQLLLHSVTRQGHSDMKTYKLRVKALRPLHLQNRPQTKGTQQFFSFFLQKY